MNARHLLTLGLASFGTLATTLFVGGCEPCDPDKEDCSSSLFDDEDSGAGNSTSAGGQGGSASGGGGSSEVPDAGMGGEPADSGEPNMCTLEDPPPPEAPLNPCDICVRTVCCAELMACSDSTVCSGEMPSDAGLATGEFGCIQEFAEASGMENDFVDYTTLEEARDACATTAVAEETEALVSCIAGTSSADPGPCANACFGIIN